jgi:hypothetical protein
MRYAKIPPSSPGYFWLKDADGEEIVEVWHDPGHPLPNTLFIHRCGSGDFAEVQTLHGVEWAGPITKPE